MVETMASRPFIKKVPVDVLTSEAMLFPVRLLATVEFLICGSDKLIRWSHSASERKCFSKYALGFHDSCIRSPLQSVCRNLDYISCLKNQQDCIV